jgi:hypothetical protein
MTRCTWASFLTAICHQAIILPQKNGREKRRQVEGSQVGFERFTSPPAPQTAMLTRQGHPKPFPNLYGHQATNGMHADGDSLSIQSTRYCGRTYSISSRIRADAGQLPKRSISSRRLLCVSSPITYCGMALVSDSRRVKKYGLNMLGMSFAAPSYHLVCH